ncbi:maleylacetate reductase [Pelagibacterium halotolerans]|uniref:Alcohol dehydrogenase n=1 Tax=Pelagibacterium halotolerans (strain DSM 22347 / JCM 15775 / CGMCC 1.7692 / B2) TaxID=1082931 RepID=G4RGI0_PELHB|nr:maleylacetate reductase [Pelagibacterium halotolerans]AEQ50156.1 alcohol dehydrogenase [Pelagibacterium halotolerans B2]QJR19835.1 maleylacetate reductase [Pelagibacterium halotolerans]SEA49273.1 maleylacetate reductase [Pelagibacterium halotolerans]
MYPFVYQALSQRVVFGSGTIDQVGDELARMELTKALVLTTPQQEETGRQMVSALGNRAAGLFAGAAMHTPVEVTEEALKQVEAIGADCVVAIGGGSTTGLGKAIALRTDLPQIVIPTSYAGSEATPILGETKEGAKTTQRSMGVLPEVIIYDVDLTMSLPAKMTVTSGLNAIAHSVEGLYTKDRNPIISILAQEGIAALARALPVIHHRPDDAQARSDALYGAWACGTVLGAVGMALHHKICHVLGGSFDLPHAETHTVVLAHATAYNERAVARELAPVADIFQSESAASGLWSFARRLDAPMTLAELGMKQSDLDRAAEIMMSNPYWNPQPLAKEDLRGLLDDAFFGRAPGTSL